MHERRNTVKFLLSGRLGVRGVSVYRIGPKILEAPCPKINAVYFTLFFFAGEFSMSEVDEPQ